MKRTFITKILPYVIAVSVVATILIFAAQSNCYRNEIINGGLFAATAVLALIAYIQLKALREQANADFLLKFNREFFANDTNQSMITAIEENEGILTANNGNFSDYQLDDYLGYYELMSWYAKRGLLDYELIDEMFGHYISMAWQNQEIQNYITELRTSTNDPRYYKPFEELAKRIIKKENEIRKNKNTSI